MYKQKFIVCVKKIYDFFDDDTFYYAASLSFFTIFSILPILALIIAIMSTYDIFLSQIQMFLFYVLDFINPAHSGEVVLFIENFLINIDKLGTLGLFYLLFVFTIFFKDYENIISRIHETQNRSFLAMIVLYINFILLIPLVLFLFTLSAAFFENEYLMGIFDFFLGGTFLTYIFMISINKQIAFKAAFYSALLTLVVLKLTKMLFWYYILYSTTYSTIYGTLSGLVFMFLWIYISWTIYLFGIKICHKLNIEYS